MDKLGLPIVLLAALWGAVNTTLSFFSNHQRQTRHDV